MKKIHLTEAQINYIRKRMLSETTNDTLRVPLQKRPGESTQTALKNTVDDTIKTTGKEKDQIEVGCNGNDVDEGIIYTKAQLKEARLNKLMRESKRYTKKNFKR